MDDQSCSSVLPAKPESKECIIETVKSPDKVDPLYELAFIEFSERGNLFDNEARNIILSKIENDATKEEGVLVVVYAHGWNHNARFQDDNVESFRKALAKIAQIDELRRGRKVYGIYLGWRGRLLPWYFNHILTYWDRKSVAKEVGKGGVSDILLRLDMIDKLNSKNTLLITGHSFGAALVSSAVNEILLHRMIEKKYNKSKSLVAFGDGVVLINPAVEVNQFLQLYELSLDPEVKDDIEKRRLLTIIASKEDFAAKYLFPVGQFFNTLFTSQKKIKRNYFPENFVSESDLDLTTIGQYKPFHTGNIIGDNNDSLAGHILSFEDCCKEPNSCSLSIGKNGFICDGYMPISFTYTSEEFIENHNDIFNNKLVAFLASQVTHRSIIDNKTEGGVGKSKDIYMLISHCTGGDGEFDNEKCFKFYYNNLCSLSTDKEDCSSDTALHGNVPPLIGW